MSNGATDLNDKALKRMFYYIVICGGKIIAKNYRDTIKLPYIEPSSADVEGDSPKTIRELHTSIGIPLNKDVVVEKVGAVKWYLDKKELKDADDKRVFREYGGYDITFFSFVVPKYVKPDKTAPNKIGWKTLKKIYVYTEALKYNPKNEQLQYIIRLLLKPITKIVV